jgi:GPH family glycoside/pentoside/hexuronide:cation symporter
MSLRATGGSDASAVLAALESAEQGIVRPAAPRAPAVPLALKTAYGVGSIAEAIKTFAFGMFLLFFYTSVLGLPGTLVGAATALGLVWDSTIDPVIGYLSDRARGRLGRRHTFMLAGSVCMGASFLAVFNPPAGLGPAALFAWLMISSLLLRTTNSTFLVPYFALGAELSQDYHERTTISGFRAGFALAGTFVAAAVSFTVFFPDARVGGGNPAFARDGYASMALWFGLAIMAAGLIATLGTLSRRAGLPDADTSDRSRLPDGRFRAGVRLSLADADFRVLALSAGLFFLAAVVNASLSIHYLTYYARVEGSRAVTFFFVAFYVGAVAGVACWLRLARRFEKHSLYCGATLATAMLMFAAYLLVGGGRPLGIGNLPPLVIGNALAGWFSSALWVLVPSMIADLAEQDEARTGLRRDGAYYGVYSFTHQGAAGIAVLLAGVAVDHFAGLQPGRVAQSMQTAERLGLLFGILPGCLLMLSAIVIPRYRVTRSRVESVQRELAVSRTRGGTSAG